MISMKVCVQPTLLAVSFAPYRECLLYTVGMGGGTKKLAYMTQSPQGLFSGGTMWAVMVL